MMEAFFAPRGVAVVGASQNPSKLGYGAARNLVVSAYPGAIHFVNPRGGRLFDRPIHPSLAAVPDPVDLAMILIPSAAVPGALEDCAARGILAVIIGSGGFRETGPEGAALERRCLDIARQAGIRVIGPNCIGLLDAHLPMDMTFLPLPGPVPGEIAFLSHSGAVCEAVIDWARGQGFGLSRLVSLGNQMDLTEADLLGPTAADPHTRVVAMYLEGVADGRDFIEKAGMVTQRTPVIAIKVGRSRSGQEAVASHTGALAGRDAAYDAAFRAAGVIRAETGEEMFDWARALAWCPLPAGRRVAVLTNAGGPGAIAADALETSDLVRAVLSEATDKRLAALLPAAASRRNPVDMLAAAGPMEYAACLEALLADDGVDAAMVIVVPPPMTTAAEVAAAIIPLIRSSGKPVVVVLMGEDLIAHAARILRQARIPDYRFPERAASALSVLADRASHLDQPRRIQAPLAGIDRPRAQELLAKAVPGADGFVDSQVAAHVAAAYGIRAVESILAGDERAATQAAELLGFPVALKVSSPDLSHKTDVGGVALGLRDGDQVREAFRRILDAAAAAHPGARVEGVIVQPMAPDGQEIILGVVRDQQFGPLVMFGSGGVEVEGLRDVGFGLAPLSLADVEHMLESTWAGRRLSGFRNLAPLDRAAVVDALLRLSALATDLPEIAEFEVNPMRVLGTGKGVLALDARLRLG